MIQVFADGVLAYDSRLEDYHLVGLKVTNGLNVGGTAEIVMPVDHPAYNYFISHKTIVTIYRDGVLRFRGRALYPADTFYGQRTITCEGELCLLRDSISRPYLYTDAPAAIFAALVDVHNNQTDSFKRFTVGTVTVEDANDYVRLESENAETVLDTINKLVERCGGYIVFTDGPDGSRAINWYATLDHQSGQTIEFGENLLDFTSTGANTTALATGLIPYGAKDEETKLRLTIESVNGGRDYILAEDAQAVRGTIMTSATWDDVTEPANLLKKAQAYLAQCKVFITSLELTALDLSYMDKNLDSFAVGDMIRVVSAPHGVNEDFQLSQMTEDLLNPAQSRITLGKDIQSLTGADVAGDRKGQNNLETAKKEIIAEYVVNEQQIVATVEKTMASEIAQSEASIVLQVSQTYARKDALTSLETSMTSEIKQQSDSILLTVSQTYATKEEHRTLSSRVETLAGSITLEVTGSLGSKANIVLKADGKTYSQDLDLSNIRQSFANDTSAVVISGGTVTFNSGTIIIKSANLTVTKDGTLSARNVELFGNLTTESDLLKSKLASGRLMFYYDSVLQGGISTTYYTDEPAKRGITVRVEQETAFISFSRDDDKDGTYTPAYIINYGMNPDGLTERHIFYGSARLTGGSFYFAQAAYFETNAIFANTYGARFQLKDGSTSVLGMYMSADNQLVVGSLEYPTYIRGSALYLGRVDMPTTIYGDDITMSNPVYCKSPVYFSNSVVFDNNYGIRCYLKDGSAHVLVLAVSDTDYVRFGHSSYQTRIYGESINLYNPTYLRSTVYCTYNLYIANQYCLRTYTADGSYGAEAVFMSKDDYLYIGDQSYPTYIRGSTVHVGTTNVNTKIYGAWIYLCSKVYCQNIPIVFANGYGVQLRATDGSDNYALSMTSSNAVMVGAANYQLRLRGSTVVLNTSGAAVTSDRRLKNSIEELPDAYLDALDKLTPVRFKYNDGTSGRYHVGFIAQEVQEALTAAGLDTQDFGGFVDLNGDGSELGLVYTQFIGLLHQKIRRLENKINELEGVKL